MAGQGPETGFTLIELSIVLVIIGLIVGGILVGQDLIKAAETRAQITQIEKYNQAVNTFRAKFQAIPGDMALATANQFGFTLGSSCDGSSAGKRDGNGLIDGGNFRQYGESAGETLAFWTDLSSSVAGSLIDGAFPNTAPISLLTCGPTGVGGGAQLTLSPGTTYIGDWLPVAKIGHGAFVYVYETNGYNWYGISTVSLINAYIQSTGEIPVLQTYNIDTKIDDGLPTTGSVQAVYLANSSGAVANASNAASDTTSTCYNTTSNAYSINSYANYGAGGNCALSFRFQ